MKLWLKWEMADTAAMLEAIDIKSELEGKRFSILQKRQTKQKELDKLKSGKNTLKTVFKSQNSIVNSITNLTREIQTIDKEIECYDVYIRTIVLQINYAAIPYFKKDKVGLYNDLINTYSQHHINNCQVISQCFAKIMELNSMLNSPQEITDPQPAQALVEKIDVPAQNLPQN